MLEDAINSATTAVSKTVTTVTNTISTAISGVTDAISDIFGSAEQFIKQVDVPKVPMPNPLHDYATYDYVLGIGCLSKEEINNPDNTYIAGRPIKLVCKSANADPENRVLTPYGKFNFFIENLEVTNLVGFGHDMNVTTANTMTFDIIEPYSMGLFMIACRQLSWELGYKNYLEVPFLLTIEFRGNTETGQIVNIPNTKRMIPFNLTEMELTVTEQGSVYRCKAMGAHLTGLTDNFSRLKSDVSVKGKTVQEVLQTGEKSLQAVINQRFKQFVDQKIRKVPDEILILFPENVATASSEPQSQGKETKEGATTASSGNSQSVEQRLGVSRSDKNSTLVQQEGKCNAIGRAKLGFGESRKGDAPIGKDNVVWDSDKGVFVRGNNAIDPQESDARFRQESSIINAINQIILNSDYTNQALDAKMMTSTGMRGVWSIEVQTYYTGEVEESTGVTPKLVVYRIVPYKAHASNLPAPNTKSPGFNELKKQALKEYNYIYTGKNIDVLSFNIEIKYGYAYLLSADLGNKSQDVKTTAQTSGSLSPLNLLSPLTGGQQPENNPSSIPTRVDYNVIETSSDKKGGGGVETPGVRAARIFLDAVTKGTDLMNLELEILGDPYYIANSGMGNYTSSPSQYDNLNADGSMNYQNGEVDILINFRTPIDINDSTGLYNFTGMDPSAPVMQYSGLYKVNEVVSRFNNGEFKQLLKGYRRSTQEYTTEPSSPSVFNTSTSSTAPLTDIYVDP